MQNEIVRGGGRGAASFQCSYHTSHRIWSECAARDLICPGLVNRLNQYEAILVYLYIWPEPLSLSITAGCSSDHETACS